ncbi:transglycosylase SLT domain-containing protein [Congregibacter brevis]|uniref:Transglycosylase SLT domain-containing protein n=1 Tax=Congregibacter brevis TaxID=3081201 RepID=A0ABZ0I805_9GAMM|nr:transglycosylase SLT domain-containing protein [Congregibacter sp. IMCC45268]
MLCLAALISVLTVPLAHAVFDTTSDGSSSAADRERFLKAQEMIEAGNWSAFDRERKALDDYPLAPYLDYERLMRRLTVTSGTKAKQFVDAQSQSPLGVRYLGSYLGATGKRRRWGDYLDAAEKEPRSENLRCYYARAIRARVAEEKAWELASRLWVSASSVDDACDPLFKLWLEADRLNDDLVWRRATLAYAAREGGLLRYVASLGSPEIQPALAALRGSYSQPQRSVDLAKSLPSPWAGDVLTLGLERYSRYKPARALRQFEALSRDALSDTQRKRVTSAVAFRGLLERDDDVKPWVDASLSQWRDDKLTTLRLRWAIAEQDWQAIDNLFFALSAQAQEEGTWRYWYARSLEARGSEADAQLLFATVAKERSYYGFLSADKLGLPYSYQDSASAKAPMTDGELPPWTSNALWRVHELNALDENRLAEAEWTYALQCLDDGQQLAFAHIAKEQGWHRLSIDAANAGRHWDALDLRFPLAFVDDFYQRAAAQSLPVSELMAIARRESAFSPTARSPVGARGLMQLMPATGRSVARKVGVPVSTKALDNIEYNITLGSAYYSQLLERFEGNRAVALAAYNAGPNRVKNWLSDELPLDAWIETIPYRETRDYVKAVLAYSVVFDYRLGEKAQLMGNANLRSID